MFSCRRNVQVTLAGKQTTVKNNQFLKLYTLISIHTWSDETFQVIVVKFQGIVVKFQGIVVKFQGIFVKFKGIVVKFKGIVVKFKGIVVIFKGIVVKFKGIVVKFKGIVVKFKGIVVKFNGIVVNREVPLIHGRSLQNYAYSPFNQKTKHQWWHD